MPEMISEIKSMTPEQIETMTEAERKARAKLLMDDLFRRFISLAISSNELPQVVDLADEAQLLKLLDVVSPMALSMADELADRMVEQAIEDMVRS